MQPPGRSFSEASLWRAGGLGGGVGGRGRLHTVLSCCECGVCVINVYVCGCVWGVWGWVICLYVFWGRCVCVEGCVCECWSVGGV